MKVDGFDWDSGNAFKNESKHGLSQEVIEAFFQSEIWVAPDAKHSTAEERFLALGKSAAGKPIIVAFTIRVRDGAKLIRPISARHMHAKEARKYEQAFAKNEKR